MHGNLLAKMTRFRAYQLDNEGSSFSYFDGTTFTLIEARLTDLNRPRVDKELEICGLKRVGCLHVTSWDVDHCKEAELEEILNRYQPARIEYPATCPPPRRRGSAWRTSSYTRPSRPSEAWLQRSRASIRRTSRG